MSATSDFLNSAPPPVAGSTQTNLGIPNDYKPPTRYYSPGPASQYSSGMEMPVPEPQNASPYTSGDVLAPLQHPEMIPALQAQLVQAGLLKAADIRPGAWGTAEQTAYRQVLELANQQGINWTQEVQQLIANPKLGSAAKSERQFALDNPVDIAATAQDTALKLIGRRLTPEEEKAITGYVQQAQEANAAANRDPSKDYTGMASPTALADQYLRKNDPKDVMSFNAVNAMNNFYGMLKSPVSP